MYLDAKPPKLWQLERAKTSSATDILDFIENDARRLVYPEQAHEACGDGQEAKQLPVGRGQAEDVIVLDALGLVAYGL